MLPCEFTSAEACLQDCIKREVFFHILENWEFSLSIFNEWQRMQRKSFFFLAYVLGLYLSHCAYTAFEIPSVQYSNCYSLLKQLLMFTRLPRISCLDDLTVCMLLYQCKSHTAGNQTVALDKVISYCTNSFVWPRTWQTGFLKRSACNRAATA